MNVQIEPTPPRRTRNSALRPLIQLAFYFGSLIPLCIIAWKLDLNGLMREQLQEAPKKLQSAPKIVDREETDELIASRSERPDRRPVNPSRSQPAARQADSIPVQAVAAERKPAKESTIEPSQIEKESSKPMPEEPQSVDESRIQRIVVDLDGRTQRVGAAFDGPLRVVSFDGHHSTVEPPGGKLDGEVVITIHWERTIALTVKRIANRFILITPTVATDAGEWVPFTTKNINRLVQDTSKALYNAESVVNGAKANKRDLESWLKGPVFRPRAQRGEANRQIGELKNLITEGGDRVKALQAELVGLKKLADFAAQLHGKHSIVIEAVAE